MSANMRSKSPFSDVFYRRLFDCISRGRLFKLKTVFDSLNVQINYQLSNGLFGLQVACEMPDRNSKARSSMINLLLLKGANPNLKNLEGLTPFAWACKHGKLDIVKVLLDKTIHDIELNTQDNNGDTPLMHATRTGNVCLVSHLVRSLSQFHLSVDVCNKSDVTPYLESKRLGFTGITEILKEEGHACESIKICPFLAELNKGYTSSPTIQNDMNLLEGKIKTRSGMRSSRSNSSVNDKLNKIPESVHTDIVKTNNKILARQNCGIEIRVTKQNQKGLPDVVTDSAEMSDRKEPCDIFSVNNCNGTGKDINVSADDESIQEVKRKEKLSNDDQSIRNDINGNNSFFNKEQKSTNTLLKPAITKMSTKVIESKDESFTLATDTNKREADDGGKADVESKSKPDGCTSGNVSLSKDHGNRMATSPSIRKGGLSRNSSRRKIVSKSTSNLSQLVLNESLKCRVQLEQEENTTTVNAEHFTRNYGSAIEYEDVYKLCPDLQMDRPRTSALDVRWMLALQAEQNGASYRHGTPLRRLVEKHDSSLSDSSQTSNVGEILPMPYQKTSIGGYETPPRNRKKVMHRQSSGLATFQEISQ